MRIFIIDGSGVVLSKTTTSSSKPFTSERNIQMSRLVNQSDSTTLTIPNKLIVVAMALLVVVGYGAFIYLTH